MYDHDMIFLLLIATIVVLVVLLAVVLWSHWRTTRRLLRELDDTREELRYAEMANQHLRQQC